MGGMSRWQSNPRGRLEQAAMDLFTERGFDQTTVADIAARAGLTERTFFRHFTDKREVLFQGGQYLEEQMVGALAAAPPTATPLAAVAAALTAAATMFDGEGRQERSRMRQHIIDANPELQEREVGKLARLGAALADGLRARGVPDPAARLAADIGIAVFYAAFEQWVRGDAGDMRALIDDCLDEVVKIAEGGR